MYKRIKRLKYREEQKRGLWYTNLACMHFESQKEMRKKKNVKTKKQKKTVFEMMLANNFPKLTKDKRTQAQEPPHTASSINTKQHMQVNSSKTAKN